MESFREGGSIKENLAFARSPEFAATKSKMVVALIYRDV